MAEQNNRPDRILFGCHLLARPSPCVENKQSASISKIMKAYSSPVLLLSLACWVPTVAAFTVSPRQHTTPASSSTTLAMGRAAAVRASTKAKTDLKKAKTNAIFGKRIIMAVKEGGGSSDPQGNRKLFDVIKQAKAASVPVDNINRASE